MTTTALPAPTTDRDQALRDMARFGFCMVANALSPERIARLREAVLRVAERQAAKGADYADLGGKRRLAWNLVNYGDQFCELATEPWAMAFLEAVIGAEGPLRNPHGPPHFLLSSLTGSINAPGTEQQEIHADQSYIPRPWPYPVVTNIAWYLDDAEALDGGTLFIPGSHLAEEFDYDAVVAPEIPAGTAVVFEGRVAHGAGANRGDRTVIRILSYYARSFMRTQAGAYRTVRPDVLERATPELLRLLGCESFETLVF